MRKGFWAPQSVSLDDGVCGFKEFSHDGDDGDLWGFSIGAKVGVFGFAERGEHATGQMAGGMPQRGCALQPQTRLVRGGRGAKPRDAHSRNGDHSATTGM